jgi:hypothetical protein
MAYVVNTIQFCWMKSALLLVVALCFLVRCVQPPSANPSIPESKLIPILKEIMIIEAGVSHIPSLKDREKDSIMSIHYKALLNRHQVKAEALESSIAAYRKHPELMDSLYGRLLREFTPETVLKAQ